MLWEKKYAYHHFLALPIPPLTADTSDCCLFRLGEAFLLRLGELFMASLLESRLP